MEYTLKEAAETLGVTKNKLKYWISKANLEIGIRDSDTGVIRISEKELEQIRSIIFPPETDLIDSCETDSIQSDVGLSDQENPSLRTMQSVDNRYQILIRQFELLTEQLAVKDQQLAAASAQTEIRLSEQASLYEQRLAEKDQTKQEQEISYEQRLAEQKAAFDSVLAEKDRRIEDNANDAKIAAAMYETQMARLTAQIESQEKRIEELSKYAERKSFWQRLFG